MPLDRRITIRILPEQTRNTFGEDVEGVPAEFAVWAEQTGAGSADTATPGGLIVSAARNYVVRWFMQLVHANIAYVSVRDADGNIWDAENIGESDARRRLIFIECIRNVS